MKYQIAIFQRAGECWNWHTVDYKLVSFDSLVKAETEAIRLSEMYSEQTILVVTVHVGFKTKTEYPIPQPVRETTRIMV